MLYDNTLSLSFSERINDAYRATNEIMYAYH